MPSAARARNLLFALVIAFAAIPALTPLAQQAEVRFIGTIEKIDGTGLILHRRNGAETSVTLDSHTAVFIGQPSNLSAVKAGDYIASAAVKGADGKLRSKELRIFPEALRGIGEGQRAMAQPDTLMTNAAVSEVVAAPEGQVVKVKYKDGTADLIVGPQVPVTAVVASSPSALKPGTKVFVIATKSTGGTITATRIMATN